MIAADDTKHVLQALADAHPDSGDVTVSGVEIHRGWGGIVTVTIVATSASGRDSLGHGRALREAVQRELGPGRFQVRLQGLR